MLYVIGIEADSLRKSNDNNVLLNLLIGSCDLHRQRSCCLAHQNWAPPGFVLDFYGQLLRLGELCFPYDCLHYCNL